MEKPDKLEVWDEAKLLLLFPGRVLVNTEDEHYKFWAGEVTDSGWRASWGRIGYKIQYKEFTSSKATADYEIDGKIYSKLRKGYREL